MQGFHMRGQIQVWYIWYIVRTFVNAPSTPTQHSNKKSISKFYCMHINSAISILKFLLQIQLENYINLYKNKHGANFLRDPHTKENQHTNPSM
jgi:hypothetical protein